MRLIELFGSHPHSCYLVFKDHAYGNSYCCRSLRSLPERPTPVKLPLDFPSQSQNFTVITKDRAATILSFPWQCKQFPGKIQKI
jgi:hypothetical protein